MGLAGIIRASSLSDLGSRSQPFYHEKQKSDLDEKKEDDGYAPKEEQLEHQRPFFQHVHDEFIQQLHDHVLDEWGIEIQNIRIESLKINDIELQKSIVIKQLMYQDSITNI